MLFNQYGYLKLVLLLQNGCSYYDQNEFGYHWHENYEKYEVRSIDQLFCDPLTNRCDPLTISVRSFDRDPLTMRSFDHTP